MTVFSLVIPGLPSECPHCGHEPPAWPLGYHALEVTVSCPACHRTIGCLVAVPGVPASDPPERR